MPRDWIKLGGRRAAIASLAVMICYGPCPCGEGPTSICRAQSAVPAPPATVLPEPVYWKQNLFLVPYQWTSVAEAGAAKAVWLLVSKDRGATWQKISEAEPHLKAFNYRAEGDGEYWFAIRTLDQYGRSWPSGPYQPELRVIVDTTMPRIEEFRVLERGDGAIQLYWHATDQYLNPSSWKVEAQGAPSGTWQAVPVSAADSTRITVGETPDPGACIGHATWQLPAGQRPNALRATIFDQAGNSATYYAQVSPRTWGTVASAGESTSAAAGLRPPALGAVDGSGWVSGFAGGDAAMSGKPSADQPWPADVVSRAPFRISTSTPTERDDGVTAYGTVPRVAGAPTDAAYEGSHGAARVNAHFASTGGEFDDSSDSVAASPPDGPVFAPLEPFRQGSVTRLPSAGNAPPLSPGASRGTGTLSEPRSASRHPLPLGEGFGENVDAKFVGSRTFAVEYDVEEVGRWGVSRVELWGTRDGGITWHSYARDDDNQSPMIVSVDEEGVYGFRIVVESAGGGPAVTPRAGDAPELWIAVDLERPIAELTAIQIGEGNFADHLTLRWRAEDENLIERPIALYYSSRPTGPWSAIATSLDNTGEYSWRVERYVPARFYLRLEARDTAGNLTAFQTREPIEFSPPQSTARIRGVDPIGPAATGMGDGYR